MFALNSHAFGYIITHSGTLNNARLASGGKAKMYRHSFAAAFRCVSCALLCGAHAHAGARRARCVFAASWVSVAAAGGAARKPHARETHE